MYDRRPSFIASVFACLAAAIVALSVLEWAASLVTRFWPQLLVLAVVITAIAVAIAVWRSRSHRNW